ncbi:phosphotransferase [Mycobacterium sp. CVI_P3]|nr:phosphotransferase [Mycobacterium pinniadriaticum]MCX2931271.1 phosphotransferase [Mycobacterium pinniadriaticum]
MNNVIEVSGPKLPESLKDVTPEWLSGVLSGERGRVVVKSVTIDKEVHGTSTMARLALQYDDSTAAASLPDRLWVKAGYEPHSDAMGQLDLYAAEARFYRDLRGELPVNAPQCYFAACDESAKRGVILIEDLDGRGATFGYSTRPVSIDTMRKILTGLARLHAAWWADPKLWELSWLQLPLDYGSPMEAYFRAHTPEVVASYLDRPRAAAVPCNIANPKALNDALWALQALMASTPSCLLHGDPHIGNMFFEKDGTPGLFDWQILRRGRWAHDVTYAIVTALDVADRRNSEEDLLKHYLAQLEEYGVDAPDFDEAWLEYRRYLAWGLMVWLVNPEDFQPDEVNEPYLTRFAIAADDLKMFTSLGLG